MNTRRLKIRLIFLAIALFAAVFVLGVLISSNTPEVTGAIAIGIMAGTAWMLFSVGATALLGLVSYTSSQKEARRGEPDHHRP